MLRNWTVTTRQIKKKRKIIEKDLEGNVLSSKTITSSALKYGSYLLNGKTASHYNTNIIDLNQAPLKIANIEKQEALRKLHRQAEGLRGGGINDVATSFVLSLPKDIPQPSPDQWKSIGKKVVKKLAEINGIPAQDLWNQSAIVLHEEPTQDKNNHLHIMVGNIYNYEMQKSLTQYKSTIAVKTTFNEAMLALGVDHRRYEPKEKNVAKKPLYVARAEKTERREAKALEKINTLMGKFTEIIRKFVYSVSNDEDVKLQQKKAEKVVDAIEDIPHRATQDKAIEIANDTANEIESPILADELEKLKEEPPTEENPTPSCKKPRTRGGKRRRRPRP